MPINKFTTTIRAINRDEKAPVRILSFSVHEGYQVELAKTGHQFVHIPSPEGKTWDEDYRTIPLNIIETSFESFMDAGKVDVAISHTLNQRHILEDICRDLSIPHICLMHCYPNPMWPELTIKNCREDDCSDLRIFTTEDSKKQWGYENDERACVIEHGIDLNLFKENGADGVNPTVLTVANEYKNRSSELGFDKYMKLMSLFGENAKDMFVHVGKSSDGFSNAAENCDHLVGLYNENGVFLNTCHRSVLPTTLLEAMACGMPVITTSNPTIETIVENGKNGYIADDETKMAEAIHEILSNIEIRNRLGKNARKTIEDRYSSDRMVKEWNEKINSILIS